MKAIAAEKPHSVDIKGYGKVFVRSLTVAEVEAEQALPEDAREKNRFPRAVAKVICDEEGRRIFDVNSEEDMKLLAAQPWASLQAILEAARKDYGIIEEADGPGK